MYVTLVITHKNVISLKVAIKMEIYVGYILLINNNAFSVTKIIIKSCTDYEISQVIT